MELPADSNARDLLAAQEEREKLSHHKKSILTQAFMSSCKFDYDLVHKALKDASAEALLAQRQLTAIASVEAKGTHAAPGVKEKAEAELRAAQEAQLLASSEMKRIDDAISRQASPENHAVWTPQELLQWLVGSESTGFDEDHTPMWTKKEVAEVMRDFSNAHVERLSLSEFIVLVLYAKQGGDGRIPVSRVEARISSGYYVWDEDEVRARAQKREQEKQRHDKEAFDEQEKWKSRDRQFGACDTWLKVCCIPRFLICLLGYIFFVPLGKMTHERRAAVGRSAVGSSPVSRWLARIDPSDWFCCKTVAGRIDCTVEDSSSM